jgi:hypothetical protein
MKTVIQNTLYCLLCLYIAWYLFQVFVNETLPKMGYYYENIYF